MVRSDSQKFSRAYKQKTLRCQVAIGAGCLSPVVSVGPLSSHLQEDGTGSGWEYIQVTEQRPLKTFDAAVENEPALQHGTGTSQWTGRVLKQ